MVLIIDVGNTSLKAGIFSSNKRLIAFYRISGNDKINDLFIFIKSKYNIASCYVCSVKPSINKNIVRAAKLTFNIDAKIIKNVEFINEFDLSKFNINEIGTDILAYALFLKKRYKKCIGFCYGTAIFAIGIDNKKLYGCIIFPVPSAGINELTKKAELITTEHKVINTGNFFEFGSNTLESLTSGSNHYYAGIVSSVISYFNKKYNFKNVCFTGGNAPKLKALNRINKKIKFFHVDNAVILGISYLIFNQNNIKKYK